MTAGGRRQTGRALPLALTALVSSAVFAFGACPEPSGNQAKLVDLDERLEALLDTGTRIRLWGVDAPQDDGKAAAGARDRLAGWLGGLPLTVRLLATQPDRWGRIEAHVHAPAPGRREPLLVSAALVDAGLARVRIEAGDPSCLTDLLALERAARRQGLGLWSDPRFRPLQASDRTAFAGRSGEQVLVEGRVQSVNDAGFATFLNFGPVHSVDFAVSLRRPLLNALQAAGRPPAFFQGHLVQVRGLLDLRYGPQVDLDNAAALGLLDEEVTRSPYSGRETRR